MVMKKGCEDCQHFCISNRARLIIAAIPGFGLAQVWKEHDMSIKVMLRINWLYLLASLAFLVGLAVLAQNVSASVGTVWRVGVGLDTGKSANNKTTDIPTTALLVGHVNWELTSRSHYIQPISLTLMMGSTEIDYPTQNTDASGYFTVSVEGL